MLRVRHTIAPGLRLPKLALVIHFHLRAHVGLSAASRPPLSGRTFAPAFPDTEPLRP
jgi:hypothetical protein